MLCAAEAEQYIFSEEYPVVCDNGVFITICNLLGKTVIKL